MSDGLIAIGGVPPSVLFRALLAFALIAALLLALAPPLSEFLLRFRARRLPAQISERLLEEWLAEVHSIEDRFGKLTFAVALAFTRTNSLVEETDKAPLAVSDLLDFADVKVPADFGIRLFALTVDRAIAWGTLKVITQLATLMVLGLYATDFVSILWFVTMQVYFVKRFGGSPGKILAKLRIVTMDGTPLTYKHAFLREAPGFVVLACTGILYAVMIFPRISYADFLALAPQARNQLMETLIPRWFLGLYITAGIAWTLGDVIAFFASYERRPLHDRVAGTMVVHRIPAIPGPPYKLERPVGEGPVLRRLLVPNREPSTDVCEDENGQPLERQYSQSYKREDYSRHVSSLWVNNDLSLSSASSVVKTQPFGAT